MKRSTVWAVLAICEGEIIPVFTGNRKQVYKKYDEVKGKTTTINDKLIFICGVGNKRTTNYESVNLL